MKPGCGTLPNAKVTHDIPVPEIFDKGIIIIKLSLGCLLLTPYYYHVC